MVIPVNQAQPAFVWEDPEATRREEEERLLYFFEWLLKGSVSEQQFGEMLVKASKIQFRDADLILRANARTLRQAVAAGIRVDRFEPEVVAAAVSLWTKHEREAAKASASGSSTGAQHQQKRREHEARYRVPTTLASELRKAMRSQPADFLGASDSSRNTGVLYVSSANLERAKKRQRATKRSAAFALRTRERVARNIRERRQGSAQFKRDLDRIVKLNEDLGGEVLFSLADLDPLSKNFDRVFVAA